MGFTTTFRWDGSYNRAHEFLQALPRSYEREKERAMRHFGINTLVDLQLRIQSGTTQPGLSPAYREWKAENGYNLGTLIRTGTYLRSLQLDVTPDGFSISPVGMEPNIEQMYGSRVKSEPRSYEEIAMWLEYGTKRMPARPHWRPTAYRARGKFPSVMRTVVEAAFERSRMGRFGGSAAHYSMSVPGSSFSEEDEE